MAYLFMKVILYQEPGKRSSKKLPLVMPRNVFDGKVA
jgi:hypothetical protein